MALTPSEVEAERIRAEYQRREREIASDFYSLTRPANLFTRHYQQQGLLRALTRAGMLPLADRRILDVGCGRGGWLAMLDDFGARHENVAGIDLDPSRLEDAKRQFPKMDLRAGDAAQLPWETGTFDLVLQSVVFTSILDRAVRVMVAREMRRVLASGGALLWYDFRYNNPQNPNVRGIAPREIRELFPDCSVELERVTLAPPIARRLVPVSWFVATALEHLRVFNTHLFALIRPR